jgi:hypothetical protein
MTTDNWTVWVGGGEYTSRYLSMNQASDLVEHLKWDLGYDDVFMEWVNV